MDVDLGFGIPGNGDGYGEASKDYPFGNELDAKTPTMAVLAVQLFSVSPRNDIRH